MSGGSEQSAIRSLAGHKDFCGLTLSDGRYEVQSKLGEGSMGIVYLAFDQRLETEVVIKVPTAATLNDPEFAERFQRETRSLVKLQHPHIVTIHDVGALEGVPYVVMQYLSGGSLRDRMTDSSGKTLPQPVGALKDWLPAVGRALDFIHKRGFLHRDVKPANILFDEHGNAFLSDFGLAKAVDAAKTPNSSRDASLTAAGFLVGTPNYVAPELVMGHEHDGSLDQYSLAMTAYEFLAGCVPVEGPTASATMVNQTTVKIPPVSHYVSTCPATVSEALLRGLAKNRLRRFPTCEDLAQAAIQTANPTVPNAAARTSSKLSREVAPGRIPCPQCRKVLPLKPAFAGKRARCGQCLHMLLIADDLKSLRVIGGPPPPVEEDEELAEAPVARRGRRSAAETHRNASRTTRRQGKPQDGELETLLGEDVFGWKLTPKFALALALATILLLMLATGLVVWFQQQREITKTVEGQRLRNTREVERFPASRSE